MTQLLCLQVQLWKLLRLCRLCRLGERSDALFFKMRHSSRASCGDFGWIWVDMENIWRKDNSQMRAIVPVRFVSSWQETEERLGIVVISGTSANPHLLSVGDC